MRSHICGAAAKSVKPNTHWLSWYVQAAAARQQQQEVVTRTPGYNPLRGARTAKNQPATCQGSKSRDAMAAATNRTAADAAKQRAPAAPSAASRRAPCERHMLAPRMLIMRCSSLRPEVTACDVPAFEIRIGLIGVQQRHCANVNLLRTSSCAVESC